jgi:ornithine carbamoyltransferase
MVRHFLDLADVDARVLRGIIDESRRLKAERRTERAARPLAGRTLAMIFDRPSTRTRVSFDVAMRELGGDTIVLTGAEMQRRRGETIADTAKVLSRYVDAIMIRTLDHGLVTELADAATVPVINGLTQHSHPCQIMADVMTFEEHLGRIDGKTVAWLGDGNNVLHSIVEAAGLMRFNVRVGTPAGYDPDQGFIEQARARGARVTLTRDPVEAAADADIVVTDTWISMGQAHADEKLAAMAPFQVNAALMARAKPDACFLHCLPAHVGDEVSQEVFEGPQSVVFDEAENRIHAQKSVLLWCFGLL